MSICVSLLLPSPLQLTLPSCIYFLNPDTIHPPPLRPALPPPDINAIRRLSVRVNVLPVIARADLLSNYRLAQLKLAVRRDLADAGIGFGIFDTDDHPDPPPSIADPSTTDQSPIMRLPYALVSPDITDSDASPRSSFLRFYRWGNLDVLDPAHCDFVPLRNAIFHHMDVCSIFSRLPSSIHPVPPPDPPKVHKRVSIRKV